MYRLDDLDAESTFVRQFHVGGYQQKFAHQT